MKIIYKEDSYLYKKYNFGYTVNAIFEENDNLDDFYEKGFLPFSGSFSSKNIYYMARSSRVFLKDFVITSENRRILKKFEQLNFKRKIVSKTEFKNDIYAINLCLEYFKIKHGENIFSYERLMFVIDFSNNVEIIEYLDDKDNKIAYVIGVRTEKIFHYWYSFFVKQHIGSSIGIFLMLDCIIKEKEMGTDFVYLGTIYGEKSLYKTNFLPIYFWDGEQWVNDLKKLKELARSDTGE